MEEIEYKKPTKEESIAKLFELKLVNKKGNLTKYGKEIWTAMNIPNRYNNYGKSSRIN